MRALNTNPDTSQLTLTQTQAWAQKESGAAGAGLFRLLVPLRGSVYVQDGQGAPLRLVFDKAREKSHVQNTTSM